jgi:RNA polymerase sigma factor (sigma-70 family)
MQQLIKAAQAGEQAAWNSLYRQYYPVLYAVALRICGNTPVAKDAVQEAFLIAYLKLAQLKEAATFGGWIKKILIHHCYRALPRNRCYKLPLESDGWWEDEINQQLDRLATQSQLYTTLARLPEVLRSTLLLRYFSAFQTYGEIATILGVPVGTIRSRLNQAKLKLTEQWQYNADADPKLFRECEEWNAFYLASFARLHQYDAEKNTFIQHLKKDVEIIFTSGNTNTGRWLIEREVVEDRQFGSWFEPANVVSCGNLSVVEVTHHNSPEHPGRCPSGSVFVLTRQQGKVSKMNFHHAPK